MYHIKLGTHSIKLSAHVIVGDTSQNFVDESHDIRIFDDEIPWITLSAVEKSQ